jgi:hypothetical protein
MANSNANTFTITITALDKATATIRGIKSEFTGLVAPVGNVLRAAEGLATETGLPTLASHAEHALGSVLRLGRGIVGGILRPLSSLAGGATGLAALAAGGGAAGLIEMAKSRAEAIEQLGVAADKTGVKIGALARLHYVARQSGVEVESMDKGLQFLNRTIVQAASGHNKQAAQIFALMHVNLHNSNGTVKDAAQLWPVLSDKFAANASIAQKTNAAMVLMGRGGRDLIPVLDKGSEYAQRFGDEFDHLHGPVTAASYAAGKQAVEAWRRLDAATDGLKDSIAIALAPALTSLITPLSEWIAKNRELIATRFGEWVKQTGDYLKSVNWKQVGHDALQFAHDFKMAIDGIKASVKFVRDTIDWIRNNWHTIGVALSFTPGMHQMGQGMLRYEQMTGPPEERAQDQKRSQLVTSAFKTVGLGAFNAITFGLPSVARLPHDLGDAGRRYGSGWDDPRMTGDTISTGIDEHQFVAALDNALRDTAANRRQTHVVPSPAPKLSDPNLSLDELLNALAGIQRPASSNSFGTLALADVSGQGASFDPAILVDATRHLAKSTAARQPVSVLERDHAIDAPAAQRVSTKFTPAVELSPALLGLPELDFTSETRRNNALRTDADIGSRDFISQPIVLSPPSKADLTGNAEITVNFNNAPPGTRVSMDHSSPNVDTTVNVGISKPSTWKN